MPSGHLFAWAARRSRRRILRPAIALGFVLALLFASGVESLTGHAHPGDPSEHHNCAVCRLVVHNVGDAPPRTADIGVPREESTPLPVAFHGRRPAAPHLVVNRLRAPPVDA